MTSTHTHRNSIDKSARNRSIRKTIRNFRKGALGVMSAAAAWLYAALYVVLGIAGCLLALAGIIVLLDVTILFGDPASTFGPGAYETFMFCLTAIKWAAIIVGAVAAFFGVTYVIGLVFRDAYEGAKSKVREGIYFVMTIIFMLPVALVQAFLENAKEYFGTLDLMDRFIDEIV